jgi:hypothetical protein
MTSPCDEVILVSQKGLELYDIRSLQTLGALLDGEFHLLAFFEVLEALTLNGRKVDEDIRTTIASDEAVAFRTIEPFDRTDNTFRHFAS